MPYRCDPEAHRGPRAELLARKAENRRQAAALSQELASLGARSRGLRERLTMLRAEHEGIEDRLAGVLHPAPPRLEPLEADDDARRGSVFVGLVVVGAAALFTVGAILGARVVASAALSQSWSRWAGGRASLSSPMASPSEEASAIDHEAMQRAFVGSIAPFSGRRGREPDAELRIPRSVVDEVLRETTTRRALEILPTPKGGLKLYPRKGSVLHRLGVRRGDVVERVNGFDLADPQRALEAYTRLKKASSIDVDVRRDGDRKRLRFAIMERTGER
jgi:general secretion pathway protein C